MKKKKKKEETPQFVVGLDIGTTKIAAIIGQRDSEGKIRVLGYGKGESTGVQHGLVVNVKKTIEGIKFAVHSAEKRAELDIEEVYVGVAGRHVRSKEFKYNFLRRNGKYNIIQKEEIDKVVDDLSNISVNDGETIITVIPQRFVVDEKHTTTDPIGEMGERIEGYFQIVTSDKYEIEKIIKSVNESDLQVKEITLEPIASSMSCLTEEEKKHGVAMVDIGGGTSDVAIYYNGKLVFTKVIPIGGQIITRDIATICRITEEQAEQIKLKYGSCVPNKSNVSNMITIPHFDGHPISISEENLANIIQARVQRDIIEKVKLAIDESGYKDYIFRGIVLTGGGSLLKNIRELCHYVTQQSIRLAMPDIGFSSLPNELRSPVFSTSLGLLKYGIQREEHPELDLEDVSIYPDNEKGNVSVNTPEPDSTKQSSKQQQPPLNNQNFFKAILDFLRELSENAS
jgi:cell division protein FtsA